MLHGNERLGARDAGYDGQNRLTSFSEGTLSNTNAGNGSVLDTVASPTLTEGFTLDSVGNWDAFSNSGTGGETRTFNAQNEITNNSGSTTPTYDYDGNMTKNDGGATIVYNAWNQLVSYNGSVAKYEYLPGGQRASATTCSTGNTQFSYFSTDWQDLEDDLPPAGSGGSVQATTYVWGLENVNELVERDSSSNVRLYAQHDANMDVTALLTTGGTVVERFSYDPYGVATVLSAAWAATSDAYNWTYRWQGGLYDLTTGLYSFQRRDYSPTLGTWLENDPAGHIDGPNTYQAMLGAPIENTDPYGLAAEPTTGSVVNSGSGTPTTGPSTGPSTTQSTTQPAAWPIWNGIDPSIRKLLVQMDDPDPLVRDPATRQLPTDIMNYPNSLDRILQLLSTGEDSPLGPEGITRLRALGLADKATVLDILDQMLTGLSRKLNKARTDQERKQILQQIHDAINVAHKLDPKGWPLPTPVPGDPAGTGAPTTGPSPGGPAGSGSATTVPSQVGPAGTGSAAPGQ